jgi:hypothetical protein
MPLPGPSPLRLRNQTNPVRFPMSIGAVRNIVLFGGALVVLLAACAQPGPVLLQNIVYHAPAGADQGRGKTVVGVSVFTDARSTPPSVVGKRTIRDSIENDLVVQGSAADLVAAAIREALKSRGIPVKDVPAGTAAAGTDLVVSGEIKTLWVDARSQPLNVQTKANVQLRAVLEEGPERKVFRTVNLNSVIDRQDVAFSFNTVQDALSEALTGAVNQLLTDEEFKKRIE